MKAEWIKFCLLLLTMLGFASCGVAKKSVKVSAPAEKSPAMNQPGPDSDPDARKGDDGPEINVEPSFRVMYGPPPASYRK